MMKTQRPLRSMFIGITLFITMLTGCSSTPDEAAKQKSEDNYYHSAKKAIKSKNYLLAVEQLEALESQFPFGRYTTQAQLDLIYVYYKSGDYDSAGLAAKRFIRLHPNHSESDYAHFMQALSAFDVDRGFLTRLLPSSAAERDLTPLYESYELFKTFSRKHPQSKYYPDAQQRMLYITNLLAEYETTVGEFYLRRGAYLAAAKRGQYVIEHFPNTPATADGLAIMVVAYRKLGMDDLANSAEQVFMLNYPDLKTLERLEEITQAKNTQWLKLLTFGLFGEDA